MIYVIFEALVVKGAIAIGHWITAHGTTAMAAKAGSVISHSIATQGLANTVAGVTGVALTSCVTVGTVAWTYEKMQPLEKGLDALFNEDYMEAAKQFKKLSNVLNVKVEYLPDVIQSFLTEKAGFSIEDAISIAESVRNLEGYITHFM
jgi:hypothetical protein